MADTHPHTLRYLPCFHFFQCAYHSNKLPNRSLHNKSTSDPDGWGWIYKEWKGFNHSPLTSYPAHTHSNQHSSLAAFLHGFLHGDTETTTDRGQLWLGAIWYPLLYVPGGCTSTYLYILRIILRFPDLNLKSDDEWWLMTRWISRFLGCLLCSLYNVVLRPRAGVMEGEYGWHRVILWGTNVITMHFLLRFTLVAYAKRHFWLDSTNNSYTTRMSFVYSFPNAHPFTHRTNRVTTSSL